MKTNEHFIGLILLISGSVLLSVLVYDYEITKRDNLSEKINKLLILLPECDYSDEKYLEIEEVLFSAQRKLVSENNYDDALSLTNLASGKLFACQQDSQIVTVHLLLFPILILMVFFGLILFLKKSPKYHL